MTLEKVCVRTFSHTLRFGVVFLQSLVNLQLMLKKVSQSPFHDQYKVCLSVLECALASCAFSRIIPTRLFCSAGFLTSSLRISTPVDLMETSLTTNRSDVPGDTFRFRLYIEALHQDKAACPGIGGRGLSATHKQAETD